MSTGSVTPLNHLILCCLLPSILLSIRLFSNESALPIRGPKYWSLSLSLSVSPSNEYSGLIAFRINWFDLLAVQGTLKSLLQHHSSTGKGALPPAPRADRFTAEIATQADGTRPVGGSPGSRAAWPGRRHPLVATVCNYSLRALTEIRVHHPLRTRREVWGVELRPGFPESGRLTIHP